MKMERRRLKLNINGVVCGIITEETDEYMNELADEVAKTITKLHDSSPMITREAAAVMAALSFVDDAKKSEQKAERMKERLTETERKALEVERKSVELQKQNKQLWEETEALLKQPSHGINPEEKEKLETRIFELERENDQLRKSAESGVPSVKSNEEVREKTLPLKNPLRNNDMGGDNFVSFFERGEDEK